MKFKKQNMLIILLFLIAIISLGSVAATDNVVNITDNSTVIDSNEVISNDTINQEKYDNSILLDDEIGLMIEDFSLEGNGQMNYENDSFTALNKLINDDITGEIILEHNYIMYDDEVSTYYNGINIINKIVTINLKGYTINANKTGRIFNVNSNCDLTLKNGNFINGNATDKGGAIYGKNINLIINNCTFSNNLCNGLYTEGGVIYLTGSELTVENSLFSNNSATAGGVIYTYNGLTLINNSKFISNAAEFYGGVFYSNGILLIDNSEFTNNSAGYRGGVIHETIGGISSGYINLKNSICNYNYAKNGGVFSSSSVANNNVISNCTMYNNSAIYGSIVSLTSKGEVYIYKSSLFNNTAIEGGVVYSITNGFILLEDNDIYTNFAEKGSVLFSLYDDIFINNCKIENNRVNNSLFYLGKGNIGIYNSTITTNNSEYDCNVIYKIENGTIYLSNDWWGSSNPNFNKLINASKTIIIFDESYEHSEPLIIEYSEGECASSILQLEGINAIINHRRDGGTHLPLFITEDNIVCQRKTVITYFFLSMTSSDGWMVGHGGWDDPDMNEKIEAISLKMINNNEITQDYCDMVYKIIESIGCGHYIIKSPNGTFYAISYKNGVGINHSGILKTGDYVVCPNGPEYFKIGHYDNIISPVTQAIYLLATDNYGTLRHNIMTYYYHDGIDEIFASNDDGSLSNFSDGGADDVWTTKKFTSGNDIPIILEKIKIDTYDFNIKTNSSWTELKNKLNNPDKDNNVFLNGETYKAITGDTGIVINKNISIYGGFDKEDLTNGTIDGNSILNCNILIAANCTVEFHNIIFENFYCDRNNDVFINNGNLTLDSVIFNIKSTEGNILVNNEKLLINNSKFLNNYCTKHLILSENTLIIENSYFNNNVFRSNEYDGIIFIEEGVCNVTNTTFSKNSIDSGGVFAVNNAYLNINCCLFMDNTCYNFGGTIYNKKGYLTINSSNFTGSGGGLGGVINNNGIRCKIYNSTFKNTRASLNGGTIYNSGLICEIYDSNFINSKAGNCGGAILNSQNTLNLTNCTFLNCNSKYGGAIYNLDELNIYGCKFINNKASKGGALFILSEGTITNCIFDNNTATNIANAVYVKNSGAQDNSLNLDYNYWTSNNPDFNSLIYGAIPEKYVLLDLNYYDTIVSLNFYPNDDSILSSMPDYEVNLYVDLKFVNNTTISNNEATLKILDEPNIISINSAYSQIPLIDLTLSNIQLSAENLTKYYGSKDEFKLLLTNNGTPLAGETVAITINGETYGLVTDNNGCISLPIGLRAGTYLVSSVYNGSYGKATLNNTITVLTTIQGSETELYYRNGTSYSVCVIDSQGKIVTSGKVRFNIHGVFYDMDINNGTASLPIGLNAGTYIITAINPTNGEMTSNNITVLSTLVGEDVTLYHRNGSSYSVKVLDGQGNPAKEVNVTMNIKGVFYCRTTDINGIATLPIGLNPGNYIITTEYNGFKTSNNITVLPVLIGENITLYYRNGTNYTVKVLDGQGNPLAGVTVCMNINGVFYYRTTGLNGVASLEICLLPGQYIVTTTYQDHVTSNTVTVLARD